MMNRERALKWLVDNIKEWPETIPYPFEGVIIDGWKFIHTNMVVKFATYDGFYNWITKEDWQAAQPAPASNKPSWDDAPEDAKWLCQDKCGEWWFSKSKINPYVFKGVMWKNPDEFPNNWCEKTYEDKPNPNWRDTLEYRPETKKDESVATESHTSIPKEFEKVEIPEATKSEMTVCIIDALGDNLNRIKEITDSHEEMRLRIECEEIELAELKNRVSKVLDYYKFNA